MGTKGPQDPIDALAALFEHGPAAVLTGAGVSTDSGIPDYRGAGMPPRTPMSISQFMHDEAYRRRFWAGARVGFLRSASVAPNAGHLALARLEAAGRIDGVITQNVDNLHRRAGSRTVVELHGNGSVIRCVDCGNRWSRAEVLGWFDDLNPGFAEEHAGAEIAPDGDARVSDTDRVEVPSCAVCGGILRPDVVYFGETVPPEVFAVAETLVRDASALLLVGTSLAVNTGVRLVHRAERRGIPVAVINRGPTSADRRESTRVRIEGGTSETLAALTAALG
ncbi:Sir2 family NAD-dependent protein deacetylase [Leucobacter tenebrionis]|uniref:Sir2 family NAD-dependent protein deacetylase n=1 Tax=Leucobacter tenebrionis TaxID=2873270 RepID=UPI001CA67CF1|nr:Sir2 family NAD-dependent protein deacetylase [Leucobacter tenebrionis]QZY53217.1 NAD-dependent deacetylase [Leucobacter tenebrionis]